MIQMMPNLWMYLYLWNMLIFFYLYIINYFNLK